MEMYGQQSGQASISNGAVSSNKGSVVSMGGVRPSPVLNARPMVSSGGGGPLGSMLPMDQRQQLLQAFNAHPAVRDLRRWLNDAPRIMSETGQGPLLTYTLGTQETISCVYWQGQHHITGTDIVKILRFRFACLGKPLGNAKKFEEGVFSDLRNLKAGEHARLEEPKSEFLEFLYRHNCIRTQKKQKVFYWFEVRHDDLMVEAFERDAKRHNQATNISNFLRSQQQMGGGMPMAMNGMGMNGMNGMAGPRLMPRAMYQPNPYGLMVGAGSEWSEPAGYANDPALDFISSLPLSSDGDNLEPAAKRPSLSGPPTIAASVSPPTPVMTSVDPSLLSALPAKAQRKVKQQMQTSSNSSTNTLYRPPPMKMVVEREEVKDPLMLDPFSFDQQQQGDNTMVGGDSLDFLDFFENGTNMAGADDLCSFLL